MAWTRLRDRDDEVESLDPRSYDRSFVILMAALAVLLPIALASGWGQTAAAVAIGLVLSGGFFGLARLGARRLAALLALLMLIALLASEMWRSDGLSNISLIGFPAVIALGSLLLTRRWFAGVAAVSVLTLTALMLAERTGRMEVRTIEPLEWGEFGALVLVLAGVAVVVDAQAAGLRRTVVLAWQNQRALEASEGRLRALIESVSEVIAVLDEDGRVRYVSPAIEKVLGYAPAERVEMNAYHLVHPDDVSRVRRSFARALASPDSQTEVELRMRHKDGDWRWIGLSGRNRVSDPAVRGVVLSYRDITERKRAEQMMRASEEKFARTFDANPHPMGIASSRDGRMMDVNESFLTTFGYTREEVIGRNAAEVGWATEEDRQRVIALIAEHGFLRNEEFEFRTKQGEKRFFLLSMEQIEILEEPCLLVASTDITERRIAEEVLRESERKFFRMFQANPSPMSISSAEDRRILEVNDAMLSTIGWTRDELIGRTPEELDTWVDPEQRERIVEELERSGSVRALEAQVRRKDRSVLTWVLSAEAVELEGRPCILWSAMDVSEAKQLADELQRAQKMEAIGRLAGGVAHDFNNCLTPVVGYSELILATMDESDPQRSRVVEIHEAGKRAAELAGQLLRMGRGKVAEPGMLDLNQVVLGTERLLRGIVGSEVELSIYLAKDLGTVLADRSQLEQVLLNLVVNARDSMPGGGRLVIETEALACGDDRPRGGPRLESGSYAMLAVSDTGVGMDASTQAKIFEPFFTTKEVGKGTGLGLATVYAIVQQIGGDIIVFSEPGKGATFKLYLPTVARRERRASAEADAASVDTASVDTASVDEGQLAGRETVLLVEDQQAVREFAEAGLRSYGYQVIVAADGAQALELIERGGADPDILVTDVVMPRMGGPELATRVCELRPGCRVVYVSGYTGRASIDRERMVPAAPLLHKPFTAEELARIVRETLGSSRASGRRERQTT
ncbi:MAG TPA: PAS domain S-box protein [Thermoanaerobaculia bacterium]|nr:PAS domain S-box protein [Thermoanaerobaculia bacterium]